MKRLATKIRTLLDDETTLDTGFKGVPSPDTYAHLRAVAYGYLRREHLKFAIPGGATVNESLLKRIRSVIPGSTQARYYRSAASQMRKLLREYSELKNAALLDYSAAEKFERIYGGSADPLRDELQLDFLQVDRALDALNDQIDRLATIIQFHYFLGLDTDELASALRITPQRAARDLRVACNWLTNWVNRYSTIADQQQLSKLFVAGQGFSARLS